MHRRHLLLLPPALSGLRPAAAQPPADWPDRPLRLVVPVSPGGPADQQARLVAQRLADRLGTPVVVENRPGANGIVAAEAVTRATDGHTIMLAPSGTYVINPSLYRTVPYDTFRDLAPIVLLSHVPLMLLAHPGVGVRTTAEFLAHVRARPQGVPYASAGSGTPSHLSMEMLATAAATGGAKLPLQHVPFPGSGPSLTALVGGQVSFAIEAVFSASPLVRAGSLVPIAGASAQPLTTFPELPTLAASGVPGFDAASWLAFVAPARLPADRIARLAREITAIVALPEVRERMLALGAEPAGGTPEELATFARREFEKWGRVVRETGASAG